MGFFSYIQDYYIGMDKGILWIEAEILFVLGFHILLTDRESLTGGVIAWLKTTAVFLAEMAVLLFLDCFFYQFMIADNRYLLCLSYTCFICLLLPVPRAGSFLSRLLISSVYLIGNFQIIGIMQGLPLEFGPVIPMFVLCILLRILMTIVLTVFLKFNYYEREMKKFSIHAVLIETACALAFITFLFNTAIRTGDISSIDRLMSLVDFCFLVIELLLYYMYQRNAANWTEILLLQGENLINRMDQARLEAVEKNYQEMRRIRHDLRNHAAYMRALLQEKNYDALNEYFNVLDTTIYQITVGIDCGNAVISQILSIEADRARNAGCRLVHNIIVPETLAIQDSDLCSILFNLLENAIEAASVSGQHEAEIGCDISVHGDYLMIWVRNPVSTLISEEELLKLNTTKQNRQEHGLGTRIVRILVAKYSGNVHYQVQNGIFTAKVMMDLKSRGKKQKAGEKEAET